MKSVKLVVMVLVLLATMLVAGTALAAPGVTLTSPSSTVQVGQEFEVYVEVSGLDQLWGAELKINYEKNKLKGISLESGFFMPGAPIMSEVGEGTATSTAVALGPEAVITIPINNKKLAVLKLKALEPGKTVIKLEKLEVVLPITTENVETIILVSPDLQLTIHQEGITSNNNNAGNGAKAPDKIDQPSAKELPRPRGRTPVDVAPGHWARSSIQQLVDGGYATGYEDGSFKPEQEITRAEFLALVTRILGMEGASTAVDVNNTFSDGSAIPAWAQGVVASAYARGLVQGDEQGRFRPNAPISRAEIAAIVIRALDEEEQSQAVGSGQQAFTDSTQASWAAGYLGRGKQLGLMTGYEDGSFRPNNRSTRAEAAALVSRMLGRLQPGAGT